MGPLGDQAGVQQQTLIVDAHTAGELASELAGKSPDTRVLYMSGYSQDIIVHQGVVDEGIDLIEKPFAAGSLLEKIRNILDVR